METRYLKIIFVIDESGSMQGSNSDVIGGFNSFVERQKTENPGKITVSLYKFNNLVTQVINNKPAAKVRNLTNEDYTPSGFTALYDAIGQAIHETDKQLTAQPEKERPDKVMVVIITDGQENASKEFSATAIKSSISTHEELLHWSFIFLGSGLDNFQDAEAMGIKYRANAPQWKLRKNIDHIADSAVMYCIKGEKDEKEIIENLLSELNSDKL
ncbi:MAG: VWA domain-containing protein [Paludibacter sp.]|nr:VWA domain-containing protein [Paludibacter sp.]